jgi:hypothetical protein
MSMYYNPTIVRLLTEERMREAREARRSSGGSEPGLLNRLRRLSVPAQIPAPCAC